MVKGPGLAHASPKKTVALGSDFGDTPTKCSSSVCSSNPSMSSMKSSSKVERETLDAIHNEVLNEIIEKLHDRQRILLQEACCLEQGLVAMPSS